MSIPVEQAVDELLRNADKGIRVPQDEKLLRLLRQLLVAYGYYLEFMLRLRPDDLLEQLELTTGLNADEYVRSQIGVWWWEILRAFAIRAVSDVIHEIGIRHSATYEQLSDPDVTLEALANIMDGTLPDYVHWNALPLEDKRVVAEGEAKEERLKVDRTDVWEMAHHLDAASAHLSDDNHADARFRSVIRHIRELSTLADRMENTLEE